MKFDQLILQDAVYAIIRGAQSRGNGLTGYRNDWPSEITLWVEDAEAENRGGMNLFGSKFGNHTRDVLLRAELEEMR